MKKKLLSLKVLLNGEAPNLTWENVGVIGKNNITYLIAMIKEELMDALEENCKDLKKELHAFRRDKAARKELCAELCVAKLKLENRKLCIKKLQSIAKTCTNMPCLVSLQGYKKWRSGEPIVYVWKGVWRYGFLLRGHGQQACILRCKKDFEGKHMLVYSYVETPSWMSLRDAKLLQKHQDNKKFMKLWRQSNLRYDGNNRDEIPALCKMTLPSAKEVLALRNESIESFVKTHKKTQTHGLKYAVELASQIKS